MRAVRGLARLLVGATARRWPDDLAEPMAREWRAEVDALSGEPGVPAARRAARVLAFAGSLAVSPAVEPEGAEAVSRTEAWGRSLAGSAAVVLLAGGLFNAVHAIQHRAGAGWSSAGLATAAVVMAGVSRWSRGGAALRAVVIGAALFGFLLAGNRIAVMPYMGWADILPAVLIWAITTIPLAYGVSRLARSGRRSLAALVAAAAGLVTLDLVAVAGGAHAALSLGVGFGTSPAWFPLTLVPGGTVTFGPALSGGLPASRLLLGNASAMIGPMLLCSVFILARAAFPPPTRLGPLGEGRPSRGLAALPQRNPWRLAEEIRRRVVPGRPYAGWSTAAGVTAAVAALTAGEVLRRTPAAGLDTTLHRLLDNSTIFGFGFLAHTPGRALTALIAGLLAAQSGTTRRPAA